METVLKSADTASTSRTARKTTAIARTRDTYNEVLVDKKLVVKHLDRRFIAKPWHCYYDSM